MINLPCLLSRGQYHTQCNQVRQSIETGMVVQNVVFVSQVVQPLAVPNTFFSVEIDGAQRATETIPRNRGVRTSASRITQKCL